MMEMHPRFLIFIFFLKSDVTGQPLDSRGDESISLAHDDENFNLSGPFAFSFWLNTSALDGTILRNDRINISISNGFMVLEARIDGGWKVSDSFPVVTDQWNHYIYQWDGNKLMVFVNTIEKSFCIKCKR